MEKRRLDHEKLTYRCAGRDMRLTDAKGNVVKEIMVSPALGRLARLIGVGRVERRQQAPAFPEVSRWQ